MARISRLGGLLADETGATAIEYALLAGFIATVIIGAVACSAWRWRASMATRTPSW